MFFSPKLEIAIKSESFSKFMILTALFMHMQKCLISTTGCVAMPLCLKLIVCIGLVYGCAYALWPNSSGFTK